MIASNNTLGILMLEPGEKLYHYTTIEGLKGICSGEFWATKSGFLNDKAEFQVATNLFCELMKEVIHDEHRLYQLLSKVTENVEAWQENNELLKQRGQYDGNYVVSFSLDYDSALMWSEYSGSLGYCMCFDFERLNSSLENIETLHGKVVYDRDDQKQIVRLAIERDYFAQDEYPSLNAWPDFNGLERDELALFCRHIAAEICFLNMFFKQPCFAGENEYRYVFMRTHSSNQVNPDYCVKQHFRTKDGVLIPFVKKRLCSLAGLESVLIGPKNSSDLASRGLREFFRCKGITAEVRQSEIPLRY